MSALRIFKSFPTGTRSKASANGRKLLKERSKQKRKPKPRDIRVDCNFVSVILSSFIFKLQSAPPPLLQLQVLSYCTEKINQRTSPVFGFWICQYLPIYICHHLQINTTDLKFQGMERKC